MGRLFLIALGLLLAALAGATYGSVAGAPESDRASYRDARLQTIGAHLRQFTGDYLLLAGDSHIEHWFAPSLCGLPVVNAGLSGATAESYSRFFADLLLPRQPRAIIMTIGTNDAQNRRIGDPNEAVAHFQATIEKLLKRAADRSKLVIVTAVPPLDPSRAAGFSPRVATRFTTVLKNTCHEQGCRFIDPFADHVRLFDGVHLDNYAGVYAGLERELCTAIAR